MTCKSQLRLLLAVAFAACFLHASRSQADTTDNATAWPPVTAMSRPWTRWWWMGSAVDAANIDRELARYQAAGLGGVEVTPIYGVKGWEDHFIPYLSPKWMEMLDHAIATGKKLGMKTDMTTGTGWCFGGPTVSAKYANATVLSSTQQVAGGASLTGTFDPEGTQALVAYSSDGKCVELTSRINSAGKVDWIAPEGSWTIYAISQKPSGVMVKRAAPGGSGPMLNPFYPAALTHYMQWFEGSFSTYTPGLNALFQDSYEYKSDWAPDFFTQFEKLRGYRLQTELPALLGDENDDHAARVKSDYRETISDIMTDESMPVWVHWAHDHGYLARYQAHGDPGNLLDLYAISDIPETEMIFTARSILVSKFASSAAHVAGKPIASAETGTWLSEHFTGTLADMKYLVDDMFLAGINRIVFHGTAYSPDNAPWPGWCFYASTEMNPRNSIWHDVPALNEYITRCQSILQAGKPDNDVLVYWPIYDNWNDAKGLVQNFDIKGAWFESRPIGKLSHELWDHGFSFDYVSDRQLSRMNAENDGYINAGGCQYYAIVVPTCHLMPAATLKQLANLQSHGVVVIFESKLPDDAPGYADLDKRRKEFHSTIRYIQTDTDVPGAETPPFLPGGINLVSNIQTQSVPFVNKDVVAALSKAEGGLGTVRRESITDHPGIHFIRRSYHGGYYYFIANRGTVPLDDWISLAAESGGVGIIHPMTGQTRYSDAFEVMDPMTGQTGFAPIRRDGKFHLRLDPGHSIILRTVENSDVQTTGPEWQPYSAGNPILLTGTWNIKFINGGPTLPSPIQTGTLASWTDFGGADAQAFAGTAVYSLTFDAPPGISGPCSIDLGKVCQSARVRLNGRSLGTLIIPPWRIDAGPLLPKGNHLEVEVTNVSANRIRDLDIRHIPWKIFYPPNVLSVHYQPLDASGWHLTESGLIGPVTLIPRGF